MPERAGRPITIPHDELLEARIEAAYQAALNCHSHALQRFQFQRMRDLIARRSLERVTQMEQERGLC